MTVFLVKTIAAFPHILLKREKFVKIFYSFVCRFFYFPFLLCPPNLFLDRLNLRMKFTQNMHAIMIPNCTVMDS